MSTRWRNVKRIIFYRLYCRKQEVEPPLRSPGEGCVYSSNLNELDAMLMAPHMYVERLSLFSPLVKSLPRVFSSLLLALTPTPSTSKVPS